ncbi:MAG: hypothetical protein NVS4B13_00140 [Candidatus Elarobacter sp.]
MHTARTNAGTTIHGRPDVTAFTAERAAFALKYVRAEDVVAGDSQPCREFIEAFLGGPTSPGWSAGDFVRMERRPGLSPPVRENAESGPEAWKPLSKAGIGQPIGCGNPFRRVTELAAARVAPATADGATVAF